MLAVYLKPLENILAFLYCKSTDSYEPTGGGGWENEKRERIFSFLFLKRWLANIFNHPVTPLIRVTPTFK